MNAPSFLLTKQKTAALVLTLFIFGVFQPTDTLLDDQEAQGTKPVEETSLVVPKAPAVQALPEVDQALITVLVEKNPLFGCWHEFVLSIESNEKTRTLLIDFLARIMLHTGHYSSPLEQIEAEFFKKLNTDCQKFFINAINRLDRSAKTLSPEAFAKLLRTVFAQLFSEINKLINKSTIARTPRFSDTCTKFFASVKPFVAVGWKEWSLGWLNWKAPVAAFFTAGTVCLGCLTWLICKRVAPVVQRVEKIGEESENQLFGPIVQGPLPAGVKGPLRGPGLIVKAKDAVAEAEAMAQRVETEILGNPEVRNEAGVVVTPAVLGLAQRLESRFYKELRDFRQMIDAWNERFTGDYVTAKNRVLIEFNAWELIFELPEDIRKFKTTLISGYSQSIALNMEVLAELSRKISILQDRLSKDLCNKVTLEIEISQTKHQYKKYCEPAITQLKTKTILAVEKFANENRVDKKNALETIKKRLAIFQIFYDPAAKASGQTALAFATLSDLFAGVRGAESFVGGQLRGSEDPQRVRWEAVSNRFFGELQSGYGPSQADHNKAIVASIEADQAGLDLHKHKVIRDILNSLSEILVFDLDLGAQSLLPGSPTASSVSEEFSIHASAADRPPAPTGPSTPPASPLAQPSVPANPSPVQAPESENPLPPLSAEVSPTRAQAQPPTPPAAQPSVPSTEQPESSGLVGCIFDLLRMSSQRSKVEKVD